MEWNKGEAIWKQIQMALVREIADGVYGPGEKLPTENALATRFSVNRHTVRSAVSALVDDNIVRVEQGRGIFVQEKVLPYPVGKRVRFTQTVSGRSQHSDRQCLSGKTIVSSKKTARELGLKPSSKVWRLEFISVVDGYPLAYSLTYLDRKRFPDIVTVFEETKSMTRVFEHFGIFDYTRTYTKVMTLIPTKSVAEHLKQPKNKPILRTESLNVDERARPIEYSFTSFASDRVELVIK